MGLPASTGLEIYTRADDLAIFIGKRGDKYGASLSRGPGHRFKLLISWKPVFDTRDVAVDQIMNFLRFVCEKAGETLTDQDNVLALIVNSKNIPVEEMQNVLTDEHLRRIEEALRTTGKANTFEMFEMAVKGT